MQLLGTEDHIAVIRRIYWYGKRRGTTWHSQSEAEAAVHRTDGM